MPIQTGSSGYRSRPPTTELTRSSPSKFALASRLSFSRKRVSCNSYLGGTGVTVLDEEMHHRTELDPSLVARNVRERDVGFLLMYHEFFSALASFSFIEAKSFVACYRKSGEPLPTMSAERSFLLINETWASATFGPSKPDYFVWTETAPDLRIAIHNPLSCHMSATLMLTRKWSGPGLDLLRRLVELEREHSPSDDESATLVVDVGDRKSVV